VPNCVLRGKTSDSIRAPQTEQRYAHAVQSSPPSMAHEKAAETAPHAERIACTISPRFFATLQLKPWSR